MVFNNGMQRPGGNYSTVDVIEPATDASGAYVLDASGMFLPQATSWMYSPTPTFYAMNISGAQRLANGNTLICSGPQGTFIEVDYEGNTVWSYKSPSGQGGAIATQGGNVTQNSVFRCTHYPVDYPGFIGHDLTPGAPIELNPLAYDCNMLALEVDELEGVGVGVFPNPASNKLQLNLTDHLIYTPYTIYDAQGRVVLSGVVESSRSEISVADLPPAFYTLQLAGRPGALRFVKE
jgi:hypothetical protein